MEYLLSELSCVVSFEDKLKEPELFSDSWIEYLVLSLTFCCVGGILLLEEPLSDLSDAIDKLDLSRVAQFFILKLSKS